MSSLPRPCCGWAIRCRRKPKDREVRRGRVTPEARRCDGLALDPQARFQIADQLNALFEASDAADRDREFPLPERSTIFRRSQPILTGGELYAMTGVVQDPRPRRTILALHKESPTRSTLRSRNNGGNSPWPPSTLRTYRCKGLCSASSGSVRPRQCGVGRTQGQNSHHTSHDPTFRQSEFHVSSPSYATPPPALQSPVRIECTRTVGGSRSSAPNGLPSCHDRFAPCSDGAMRRTPGTRRGSFGTPMVMAA
jgi:hypothetical protein